MGNQLNFNGMMNTGDVSGQGANVNGDINMMGSLNMKQSSGKKSSNMGKQGYQDGMKRGDKNVSKRDMVKKDSKGYNDLKVNFQDNQDVNYKNKLNEIISSKDKKANKQSKKFVLLNLEKLRSGNELSDEQMGQLV